MTHLAATPTAPVAAASWYERHHFLIRRLHSLTGVMPVGVFVIFHLFTNMQLAVGDFQHEVDYIHSLPALLFLEIFGLWLPIGFHAGLGLIYTFSGRPNSLAYPHADNWRYTFQRVTGIVALVFIFLHIATLRWGWNLLGWYTPFYTHAVDAAGHVVARDIQGDPLPLARASTALALQSSVWIAVLYALGLVAVVFHWANGLWTAAITWGLTLSVAAQRRWGLVCAAVGLTCAVFSVLAMWGALTYQPTDAETQAYRLLAARDTPTAVAQPPPQDAQPPEVDH